MTGVQTRHLFRTARIAVQPERLNVTRAPASLGDVPLKTLGKGRTTEVLSEPIVPVVYPTGASMSSTPPRVSWEWPPPGAEMDPDHHHGGAE